jgi:hypothetical protein
MPRQSLAAFATSPLTPLYSWLSSCRGPPAISILLSGLPSTSLPLLGSVWSRRSGFVDGDEGACQSICKPRLSFTAVLSSWSVPR